jgi:hypothetical protein
MKPPRAGNAGPDQGTLGQAHAIRGPATLRKRFELCDPRPTLSYKMAYNYLVRHRLEPSPTYIVPGQTLAVPCRIVRFVPLSELIILRSPFRVQLAPLEAATARCLEVVATGRALATITVRRLGFEADDDGHFVLADEDGFRLAHRALIARAPLSTAVCISIGTGLDQPL